jgi:hypothetical protein
LVNKVFGWPGYVRYWSHMAFNAFRRAARSLTQPPYTSVPMTKPRPGRSMITQLDASLLREWFFRGLYGDFCPCRKQKIPVGTWASSYLVIHLYFSDGEQEGELCQIAIALRRQWLCPCS